MQALINIFSKLINILIITIGKRYFLSLILFQSVGNCFVWSQDNNVFKETELFYPNGALAARGFMRENKPDGYWITFYESGIKKSEGNRKNFELDGLWIFYDSLGAVVRIIEFRDGLKHGKYVNYENGFIKDSCIYLHDTIFAKKYTFEKGSLKFVHSYSKGKENGDAFEFDSTGNIITVLKYTDGAVTRQLKINRKNNNGFLDGMYMSFYDDFKVKEEGMYSQGIKNGIFKYYNTNGELIRSEIWRNGILATDSVVSNVDFKRVYYAGSRVIKSEGLYTQDNNPIGRHNFYNKNGEYIESRHYSPFGVLVKDGRYNTNQKKEGIWTEYYENGNIRSRGNYIDGKKEGLWEYFYLDGSLEQRGVYKNDLPHDLWTTYCANGNIRKQGTYINGREDGVFTEYTCDGELIKRINFIDGFKNGEFYLCIQSFIEQGLYIDDMKSGKWQTFYDKNTIRSITHYENDLENGKFIKYYPNGKVMISGNYFNGKREGLWSFYDDKGNRYLTIEYKANDEIKYNGVRISKK